MSQDQDEDTLDLAASEKAIGAIYPVLKDAQGNVLDGVHRLQADPKWPVKVIQVKDPKEKLLIRIHANEQRRQIPREEKEEWVKEARKIVQSEGKKGTQEEIAEFLGFRRQWISDYDVAPIKPQKERSDKGGITAEARLLQSAHGKLITDLQTKAIEERGVPLSKQELKEATGLSERQVGFTFRQLPPELKNALPANFQKIEPASPEVEKAAVAFTQVMKGMTNGKNEPNAKLMRRLATNSVLSMVEDGTLHCSHHKGVRLMWSCGDELALEGNA